MGIFQKVAAALTASVAWPARCEAVGASAASDEQGVMICFWAVNVARGPQLLLIDYDRADDFAGAAAYLDHLATQEPPARPFTHAELLQGKRNLPAASTYDLGAPDAPMIILPRALRSHATPWFNLMSDHTAQRILDNQEELLHGATIMLRQQRVVRSSIAASRAREVPNPLAEVKVGAPPTAGQTAAMLAIFSTVGVPREFRVAHPDH